MATLAPGGRVSRGVLDAELGRLRAAWQTVPAGGSDDALLAEVLGKKRAAELDLFDRAQLACVLRVCRASPTLSEAGRQLFSISRESRKVTNDADRLRKYLARFKITWAQCSGKK
jgi:transcriptional regulatory protein RtcR